MLSLTEIQNFQEEHAAIAAKRRLIPFMVWKEDLPRWRTQEKSLPFPNIGSYQPPGWEMVRRLFCDSSGFEQPGELAMTAEEMLGEIKPGMGYAIVEEGQFQLYLGEFKRVPMN